jgi:hypothetical protein
MTTRPIRAEAVVTIGDTTGGAIAFRHRGGCHVTVIAKATFALAADAPMPRVEPQPLLRDDVHHDDSPARSVRFASDLVPYLDCAEVVLTGHAEPPSGVRAETLPLRLGLFDGATALLDKTVLAQKRGGVGRVPIDYEHAFGGIGFADNPLGTGARPGDAEPSLVDVVDPRAVACFAPLPRAWPSRRARMASLPHRPFDEAWLDVPDDFDWECLHAAPKDQRVRFLRGDEWIVMDALHPAHPRFRTRLPGARGVARVHGLSRFGVAEGQPLALQADSLRIDLDDEVCTLAFRAAFPIPREEALASLCVELGVELPGEPVVWFDPGSLPTAPLDEATVEAMDDDEAPPALMGTLLVSSWSELPPSLPFAAGRGPAPAPTPAPARPLPPERFTGTIVPGVADAPSPALPFAPPLGGDAPTVPVPAPPPPPPRDAAPAKRAESPWAEPAPAAAAPPPPKAPKPAPPRAPASIRRGLYGRFGGTS